MARAPKPSGGRNSGPRDRGDLLDALRRWGWSTRTMPGGHCRATPPDGGPYVVFPMTGGDRLGIRRTVSDIRRVTGWDFRRPDPRPGA